jgi:hypothetical protein
VILKCLKQSCPLECGTRRHPGCADRMAFRILFVAFAAVLILSVLIGVRDLNTRTRSESVIAEPPPVARAETVQLVSEPSNYTRERVLGDVHRKSAVPANESVQVPQQRRSSG